MADLDTYNDEPRQYDGKQTPTRPPAKPPRPGSEAIYKRTCYMIDVGLRLPTELQLINHIADERDYPGPPRDRSRSPIGDRDGDARIRDEPVNGRDSRGPPPDRGDDNAVNPGSNLFVTGIHPRLTEEEISRLFEKYGQVEKCNIMRDPHSHESRGFGFVKMVTAEEADAAKDGLQGEVYEGRTLSIEKARRARPRTPTPGKYFGPPKRGPPTHSYPPYCWIFPRYHYGSKTAMLTSSLDERPPRGGYRDRYDDRSYGRRDDFRRGGYRDRYDDRGYGRRDDYRGGDRYRDDRYERRGGGYGYDRPPRGPPPDVVGYGRDAPAGDVPPPRSYDDRRRYD
ncbi:hypothetical protein D0860_00397 [Hortaea werneckii]|uniref:RRM domain-containing protein n=1 Tax=Hortaea werneckii TaxID=91943 RepID=A0A3M7HWM7_HORWE|nr:hypothetical protein D0860_00397 [Hortaea werneckii]